jgi:hypothetical protein
MRKIPRALLAGSICVTMTVASFGCGRNDGGKVNDNSVKNKVPLFAAEMEHGSLNAEKKTLEIGFKNGDPVSVNPKQNGAVKAEVKDKKVHFSLVGDLPEQEATLAFLVEGSSENDKVWINIALPRKPRPLPPADNLPYEDLDPSIATILYKMDKDGLANQTTFNFTKGVVDSVVVIGAPLAPKTVSPNSAVKRAGGSEMKLLPIEVRSGKLLATGSGRQLTIMTEGVIEPGRYEVNVTAKGGKAGAKIYVDAVVPPPLGLTVPMLPEGGQLVQLVPQPQQTKTISFDKDKLEGEIPAKGADPLKFEVKVTSGKAERTECLGKGLIAVLSSDKDVVLISVSAEAEPGSYDIWIIGKDAKGADDRVVLTVLLKMGGS